MELELMIRHAREVETTKGVMEAMPLWRKIDEYRERERKKLLKEKDLKKGL